MINTQKPVFAAKIDEAVAPLLAILRDAGRERERVALELGSEIAKQLTPFSLIALVAFAGFIIGRKSNRRLVEREGSGDSSSVLVQIPQSQHPPGDHSTS